MTTTAYTTKESVIAKLGLGAVTDAGLEAYIDSLILQVSALFDTIVWGPDPFGFVWSTNETEYFDGGQHTITLGRLMDQTLRATSTTITEDGLPLIVTGLNPDVLINPYPSNTIWRLSASGVLALDNRFDRVFSPGNRNIIVTYRPAYSAPPADVARACDEESARAFKAGTSDTGDGGFIALTGRTPDAGTTLSYTLDDLTATTMRMLDGYRKRLSFV